MAIEQNLEQVPAFLKTHDGKLSGTALVALIFGVILFAQLVVVAAYLLIRRVNAMAERETAVANNMHMSFLEAVEAEHLNSTSNSSASASASSPTKYTTTTSQHASAVMSDEIARIRHLTV